MTKRSNSRGRERQPTWELILPNPGMHSQIIKSYDNLLDIMTMPEPSMPIISQVF